jgi:hypothetical protein
MLSPQEETIYLQWVRVMRILDVRKPEEKALEFMKHPNWRKDLDWLRTLQIIRTFAESGVRYNCDGADKMLQETNDKINKIICD